MRIRLSQLRRIIKEEVKRTIMETAAPALKLDNDYFCITIGNTTYEFMPEQIETLINPALRNTELSVFDLDYNDDEGGCMLRCDKKDGPIKLTVNKKGETEGNHDIDFGVANAILNP